MAMHLFRFLGPFLFAGVLGAETTPVAQQPRTQQPGTQQPGTQQPAAPAGQAPGSGTEFTAERLEQLVAPIALYPDGLLAQVLMASTYPIEIVEAARWIEKNPKLSGEKLEAALKDKDWDVSVKSLCGLPDVLKRMNENLDWTQDLGDAFLAQKGRLMDAVQVMRRKAYDGGTLKSSEQMTVTEKEDKIIVIESSKPEVVYVPTYYPTAVYPGWSYPVYYYPPMYPVAPAGGMFLSFTAGVFWGAAIWGGCSWGWGHSEVDIDINRQNNFERNVNRDGMRGEARPKSGTRESWNHDPQHRKGAGYKDQSVAQRYGGTGASNRVTRDQARGYADRTGQRPSAGTRDVGGTRPGSGTGARPQPATRPTTGGSTARPSATTRPSSTSGQRSGSFSGARSPAVDRAGSARGSASRGSSGSFGGRSGGGGMRGGGGRGGGRR